MKDYQEVVNSRYAEISHPYHNKYSIINPIGLYIYGNLMGKLVDIFNMFRNEGLDIKALKIMDLGCGAGIISRMIAEITETTENLCGVDLSDVRIKQAQLMNSSINYHINDITKLDKQESSLDVIFCMVTLMHLSEREQISKVLQWIYNSLRPGGYFIWLEENAKDHYKPLPNADGWGFSLNQMEELTQMVGLKQKRRYKLYKNIFCRLHSLFLREKIPNWIVRISELFLPGSPGSNLVVFQKIM